MNIIADLHCHTIASTHAFSTIMENVTIAAARGLSAIAVTDHGPDAQDAPHIWHFGNLGVVPSFIQGVRVLKGVEANLINLNGEIDIPEGILKRLEWVIASCHDNVSPRGSREEYTGMYLKALENPYIHVLGHLGDERFACDYEKVAAGCKSHGKIIEINAHSFSARPGSPENCREIALCCKRLGVPVVVNSDAHFCYEVGQFDDALELLQDIDFPEELVINSSINRLEKHIKIK